jgi:hypothetical protein
MDSVNTVIRCLYSTLPHNGRFPNNPQKEKRNVQVLQIYKGADYNTEDAVGRCDRALTKFSRKITNNRKFRKIGSYGKTEDADNRKIGSHEES